jgi:hypothetical protein
VRKDVREFIRRLETVGLIVEATPRPPRRQAPAQSQRDAVHASVLTRHDPLARDGDRRPSQARHRRLRPRTSTASSTIPWASTSEATRPCRSDRTNLERQKPRFKHRNQDFFPYGVDAELSVVNGVFACSRTVRPSRFPAAIA